MICPHCQAEGTESHVVELCSSSTLIGWSPYYDEKGVYHSHDPNARTTQFECSRGHHFSTSRMVPCPNCDYGRPLELATG